MATEYKSFGEFWPFYVGEHSKPTTRAFHAVGTSTAVGIAITAVITRRPALLLGALVAGYGPAWVSHFFIENNRPASFKYPGWSFLADFKMLGLMLRGKMSAEVARVASAANGAGRHDLHVTAARDGASERVDPHLAN